ncbi:MAG: hypothetical protein HRT82_10110 [Henriciella sp.]|nr:hypothetical protein [Henriciella sp.]
MHNHAVQPLRPLSTVRMVTAYVARWPLRHVYGGKWLSDHFDRTLKQIGPHAVLKVYGLEFRDSSSPPKIHDLVLVSIMQGLILFGVIGLSWWSWKTTNDYVLPAFIVFSVFHVIPSDRDFLTSGSLAERVPSWLTPLTSALSFIVSLPAMFVALPASIVWGLLGLLKLSFSNSEPR